MMEILRTIVCGFIVIFYWLPLVDTATKFWTREYRKSMRVRGWGKYKK